MDKWLYIPVEVKVRELQAKLLLAKFAASQGYNVVIGRKSEILDIIHWLPRGIFFGMWVPVNFKSLYARLKFKGFKTTGLDEEGLVIFSDEIYTKIRLSKETLSYVDTFFAWGEYQANIVKRLTNENTKISLVGNLRFDLLRPEMRALLKPEADIIKRNHGRIVLIVSSFAFSNHFSGAEAYMTAQKKSKIIQTPEDEAFFRRYMELQDKNFEYFIKAIPELAKKFPEHTFIIRPHPSEKISVWEDCAQKSGNIKIDNTGNVHAWIVASECIVHHFCTTALEAFAANIPAVAYRPFKDSELESDLPYWGSLEVDCESELVLQLNDILVGNTKRIDLRRQEKLPVLKTYIQNLDSALCVERIIEEVRGLEVEPESFVDLKLRFFYIRNKVMTALKWLKASLLRKGCSAYIDHKFPKFTKEEIELVFQSIPGDIDLKIEPIASYCYRIRKA
ncbi:MAG: hypothetical protein DI586_09715 [Micavibrio aeruginosavorus]|uniref:Surface carbohydrate biosynthesis protein n=1 Tax=Micavibrio aeruginosavorus TaxID=349221 RepID=A0A2W5H8X3_9BACT|nr:MAG: hypothetical protein DI586_09715 [Micavibrio aeruginosavorus]